MVVCLERNVLHLPFLYICIFKDIIYIVTVFRLILLLCVVYIISFFKMTVTVNSYVQTNMYLKDKIQVRGFNTWLHLTWPCIGHVLTIEFKGINQLSLQECIWDIYRIRHNWRKPYFLPISCTMMVEQNVLLFYEFTCCSWWICAWFVRSATEELWTKHSGRSWFCSGGHRGSIDIDSVSFCLLSEEKKGWNNSQKHFNWKRK